MPEKIGFGGGCHWCTEAVFLSLKGVTAVRQGWISAAAEPENFSEAVLVCFDPEMISADTLIEIHLRTHSSTGAHRFRAKYRSAVYTFSARQEKESIKTLNNLQAHFPSPLITRVLSFFAFRENIDRYRNYFGKYPDAPFCRTYIDPRLQFLKKEFARHTR